MFFFPEKEKEWLNMDMLECNSGIIISLVMKEKKGPDGKSLLLLSTLSKPSHGTVGSNCWPVCVSLSKT